MSSIHDNLSNIDKWSQPRIRDTTIVTCPAYSYIIPEPYGVVLVIGTWNYPLQTSLGAVISAIAAGNCVIMKPHRTAPATAKVMTKLFD